ncbi:Paramyosin [Dissostichus eleginoides]|uniref:Paramyosin n=1 Tax=Dissostichus eleginoides TaxID=100907 RepID=A0AAD9C6F2_DISEL|nr:Paramyosin [Dissostichus eleginoides]
MEEDSKSIVSILTWLVPKDTHLTCPQTAKKLRVPGQLAAANVPSVPVLLTHNKHRDNTERQKGDSDVSRPSQD